MSLRLFTPNVYTRVYIYMHIYDGNVHMLLLYVCQCFSLFQICISLCRTPHNLITTAECTHLYVFCDGRQ